MPSVIMLLSTDSDREKIHIIADGSVSLKEEAAYGKELIKV
jgi:hypothetical protein